MKELIKKTMGLCEGRHPIPGVTEYIFESEVNPLDTAALFNHAQATLKGIDQLDLYVTGLSVALLAVVNYCSQEGIDLDCYHYNRDTGDYYRQPVLWQERCPFCYEPKGHGWYCQHCGST